MNELPYTLIIEASETPGFFSFRSPDLTGFSGMGRSIEECIRSAKRGMMEYIAHRRDRGLPIPRQTDCSRIITA